jgi:hypothetical protein
MRALALSLVLLSITACGEADPKPPIAGFPAQPGPSGGGGGSDASVVDAGGDAGIDGDYPIDMTAPLGGNLAITGTVRAPAPVQQGRLIVVTLLSTSSAATASGQFTLSTASQTIKYRIGGLVTDNYVLRFQIDQAGSAAVGEQGDFEGFYNGVETAPILTRQDALPIPLGQTCLPNIDFGVGTRL